MRYIILPLLFMVTLFSSAKGTTVSAPFPSRSSIITDANRVADWQLRNFSYSTSGNLHDNGIASWTHAVLYLGAALWRDVPTAETDRLDAWLLDIGTKGKWSMNGIYPYHADEFCVGQSYALLSKRCADDAMVQPTIERMDWVINNPPSSTSMTYTNKKVWSWCDALFMAPPLYAQVSQIKNDPKYLHFMHQEFDRTYKHLFDQDEKLFYRDDSYFGKTEANGRKVFWGRGNGWALAGIANILRFLPQGSELRSYYEGTFRSLALRLIQLQDVQGAWHASLLDPDSYPAPETSCTALITYALAYGINARLLTPEEALPAVTRAWTVLCNAIHDNGKLGWVQPIGQDPKKVTRDMTATFGVGAFLMAATQLYALASEDTSLLPTLPSDSPYNDPSTQVALFDFQGNHLFTSLGGRRAVNALLSHHHAFSGFYIVELTQGTQRKVVKYHYRKA